MAELLCVKDLTKVYGKRGAVTRALDGVDLSLEAGEYVGIMGASGSGKTTLLNCISTIDRPTSGSIQVDGQELTGLRGRALTRFRRERLGFIFQDCNLLDTLTAFENIALSLSILRTPAARDPGPGGGDGRNCWASGTVWTSIPIRCPADSSSAAPPPGPSSPGPPWCWPTSPPGPWTPSPPGCCWSGWRCSTGSGGPPF